MANNGQEDVEEQERRLHEHMILSASQYRLAGTPTPLYSAVQQNPYASFPPFPTVDPVARLAPYAAQNYVDPYYQQHIQQQNSLYQQNHHLAFSSSPLNYAVAAANENNAHQLHLARMMMIANEDKARREYQSLQQAAAAAPSPPPAANLPPEARVLRTPQQEQPQVASLPQKEEYSGQQSDPSQSSEMEPPEDVASDPSDVALEESNGQSLEAEAVPAARKKDDQSSSKKKKDIKWMAAYKELLEYKEEYGDCIVPRGFLPSPRLASWVAEQRKQYKLLQDGKRSSITQERIKLLNSIGFAWNAQEAAWQRHVDDLRRYKEEYGDCLVPLNHPEYPKLGLWVKEQRRHFTLMNQGRMSHMTEERAQTLQEMGFCWDTHEANWGERLSELRKYKEKFGDTMVPINHGKLGTWVNHQRRQYKKYMEGKTCHISEARIQALEKLGFNFNPRNRPMRRQDDNSDSSIESDDGDSSSVDSRPYKRRKRS